MLNQQKKMKVMTKQELIKQVANATNMEQPQVRSVVEASILAIKECIANGGALHIRRFGTLHSVLRKEKLARNISKGTSVSVPAHYTPVFKPSKEFKSQVSNRNIN